MLRYIALLSCVVSVFSHICLITPHPRGGAIRGINFKDSPDCMLQTAPCGGRLTETPQVTTLNGANFTVIFRQNKNFLNPLNPGYFSVAFGLTDADLEEVLRIPDTGKPDMELILADVTIPAPGLTPRHVVQVAYITNLGFNYYQCADIDIDQE